MLNRSRCLTIFVMIFAVSHILIAGEPVINRALAAPVAQAAHGLKGYYYVSNLEWHTDAPPLSAFYVQVYFNDNDFMLPKPMKDAAATRVDGQIAFGQGQGFVPRDGKQFAWWATDYAPPKDWPNPNDHPWDYTAAVIWKGYIHLPKAGTYYFSTISYGASAVYLNQARVALNGSSTSLLNSDAFAYAHDDVQDFIQNISSGRDDIAFQDRSDDTYVVPVTTDAPRDLPIEVDYNAWIKYGRAGIDFFWLTPDSPRDANGKPIAQLVPSDALYVDPPGPIEQPAVRSVNSTISPDHLYPPADGLTFTTLTIRLADENGQPVAGKHVYVSTLSGYGPLSNFTLVQPDKPTDENGQATFKVKTLNGDDLTFFATDVDDLVDVAQVAHVTLVPSSPDDFFPDTFAPYYDGNNFLVAPLPPRVGQPTTIQLPLKNHGKQPAELTATFFVHDWNIGASDWKEIGKTEHIVIQPGETKEAKYVWIPQQESGHICMKIEISGQHQSAQIPGANVALASLLPNGLWPLSGILPAADQPIPSATRTRNLGPVVLQCQPPLDPSDPAMFGLPAGNTMISHYGNCRVYHGSVPHTIQLDPCSPSAYTPQPGDDLSTPDKPNPRPHPGNDYTSRATITSTAPTALPFMTPVRGKVKLYNSDVNTIGIVTCDGYEVQFLHASQRDVIDGQLVSPGTRLGLTGKSGASAIHLHVQVRNPQGQIVDLNTEGPLVNRPPCDPAPPCLPDLGDVPSILVNPGESPKEYGRRTAPLYRRKADEFYRHIMLDVLTPDENAAAVKEFNSWNAAANAAEQLAADPPAPDYQTLAAAATDTPAGYIDAVRQSLERYQGAQAEGDQEWMARHLTAARLYLGKVAEAERQAADDLSKLADKSSGDDSPKALADLETARGQFLERIRQSQLSAGELKQLQTYGISPETARAVNQRLLAYGTTIDESELSEPLPSPKSLRTLLLSAAMLDKDFATQAEQIASRMAKVNIPGDALFQSYAVANPHDKEETIDLFIRPVSIPPNWKLSIVSAEAQTNGPGSTPTVDPSKPVIREIEAGKHYAVTLPAKATIQVASVLTPTGEVGANTTVRWAVEGKIGNELIGGMMHELDVPYIIPDLQLPPVGSASPSSAVPFVPGASIFVVGITITVLLTLIVFGRRMARRRRA